MSRPPLPATKRSPSPRRSSAPGTAAHAHARNKRDLTPCCTSERHAPSGAHPPSRSRSTKPASDTTHRLIAQQQEHLARQRKLTAERLAVAKHELRHLHWWNRRPRTRSPDRPSPVRAQASRREVRTTPAARGAVIAISLDHSQARRTHALAAPGTPTPGAGGQALIRVRAVIGP